MNDNAAMLMNLNEDQ